MSKWTILLTPLTATAAYLFQTDYNTGDGKRHSWAWFLKTHIKAILEKKSNDPTIRPN